MNAGLIQTLLEAVQTLQASVKAIEAKLDNHSSRVVPTYTEALESGLQAVEFPVAEETTKKHPLEDYKITEKDVWSLVVLSDRGDDSQLAETVLWEVGADLDYPYRDSRGFTWQQAKPHLDPVSLHFKPFYATKDSKAPDDLGESGYAVLWNNGLIEVADSREAMNEDVWKIPGDCEEWQYVIIGYRPLSFVNPVLDVEK